MSLSLLKHFISRSVHARRSRQRLSLGVPEQLEVRAVLDGTGTTILDITLTDPADIFTDVPPPIELPPLIETTIMPDTPAEIPVLTIPTIDLDALFADESSGFGIEITASLGVVPPDETGGVIPPGFDEADDADNILTDITITIPPIEILPGVDIIIGIGIETSITPDGTVDPTLNITIEFPF